MPTDVPESVEDVTGRHLLLQLVQAFKQHTSFDNPLDFKARIDSRSVTDARPLGTAQRSAHGVGQSARLAVVSMLCWSQRSWAERL